MSGEDEAVTWFRRPPQTAEQPYQDAFNQELESLKERVRGCAQARLESAVKELEEEDRQESPGPGGLDPVEVYQSLPKVGAPVHWFWRFVVRASGHSGLEPRDGAATFMEPYLVAKSVNWVQVSYRTRFST